MREKKTATLNIGKALSGVPLAAIAAAGSATSIPWLAALSALPLAILSTSDTLGTLIEKLKLHNHNQETLEIAAPRSWTRGAQAWQEVCTESIDNLPIILEKMPEFLKSDERFKTVEVVRENLIKTFVAFPFANTRDSGEKRIIAETLATPILQKLEEALSPIIEQIKQDEAKQDIHYIAENTKETVKLLKEAFNKDKARIPDTEGMASLRQQYRDTLYEHWKMLDFKGIMHVEMNQPMSIPLTEVFEIPDVLVGIPEYETLERDEKYEGEIKDVKEEFTEITPKHKRSEELDPIRRNKKSITFQREILQTVLAKSRRIVILGDPGAGKSTLLRYLMLLLVGKSEMFSTIFPQLTAMVTSIPFYITLAAYTEFWRSSSSGERTLRHFLPKCLSDNYLDGYTSFLQYQLEHGNVILLLDGLDEIPDASMRIQIVRQIEAFTQAYPDNYFMVTSRIVGYREAPLAAGYQAYTLSDFDEAQIKSFAQKWCPAYERWVRGTTDNRYLQDATTKEAEKLFNATQRNAGVKRLAVNPLLLTILALIQRQGRELPSHRIELFDLCATTLLETWVNARGRSTQLSKTELIKILRPLAFWMHEHPEVGAISEEDLTKQIITQLCERGVTNDEATKRAEQFFQTVRGETGILIERGKNRYGFLHLTFEEYFAASELEQSEEQEEFITKHLHEARWHEVILLTVGIVGIISSNEKGVTNLVQNVILNANSPFEKWLHRDLLFAGLCLADDIGINIRCEKDIVEQIIYYYLTSPYNTTRSAFQDILSAWAGTQMATKAINLILPIFLESLENVDTSLSLAASTAQEFSKKVKGYYMYLIAEYTEALKKLFYLRVAAALPSLRIYVANWVEYGVELLANFGSDIRLEVVQTLGQVGTGHPEVVTALLQILSDSDSDRQVRPDVVQALGQIGIGHPEVVTALLQILSSSDWRVRPAVVQALGQIGAGHPKVVTALLQTLSDSDRRVRQAAGQALGQIGTGHPEVVTALLQTLSDSDSDWLGRQATVQALGQIGAGHPEVVTALLQILSDSDSDWHVRQAAGQALGQIGTGHPEVVTALLQTLSSSDSDWQVRQATGQALGQIGTGHPEVVTALLQALSDSDGQVRQAAVQALGQIGTGHPEVVTALLQTLSDSDGQVHPVLVQALGQIGTGHPEVVTALLQTLSSSDGRVYPVLVQALGQIGAGHPEVVTALLQILSDSDSDWQVRQDTVQALGEIGAGHPEVVTALLQILFSSSDSDWRVRPAAVQALGQIGTGHPEVVTALLQILSSSDWHVRQAAVQTLGQIGAGHPEITEYISSIPMNILTNRILQRNVESLNKGIRQSTALRQLAILKLLATGHPEVVTALLQTLSSSDSDWLGRQVTVQALGQIGTGHPEVVTALLQTLSDSDWQVRQAAVQALGQIGAGHPEVVTALLQILSDYSDSDWQVRPVLVQALGQIGTGHPEVVTALLQTLSDYSDSGWQVRPDVVQALGQIGTGHPEVVTALLQTFFYSSDWQVRQAAGQALGQIGTGHPEVVTALLQILFSSSDSDRQVRPDVVQALGQIGAGHPEVVTALLQILSDSDSDGRVRPATVQALGQIGAGHPEVVTALLQILSDSDGRVRQAANEALSIIPASHEISIQFLERCLQRVEHITNKQLEADDIFDNMLNALWQIMRERQS